MNETACDKTLRFLCEAVHNFHWVSGHIYPEAKRLQVLKKFAVELRTTADNFIKACEEAEHDRT